MRRTPPPSRCTSHVIVALVAALLVGCSGGDTSTEGEALAAPVETATPTESGPEADTDDGADAEAIEATCAALARAGQERGRDFPAPDDHGGLLAFLVDEAARYEDIATPMRAIGSPREVRRAEILEEAATAMRDASATLADALSTGHAPYSPEELTSLDEHIAWLDDVKRELLMWRAHTCDDVPGVTRSEIQGIPQVHLEVDEETGWPEPIDATD